MMSAAEHEMEEDLFGSDSPLEGRWRAQIARLQQKITRLKARVSKRDDSLQKEIAKRKEEKKAHKKVVAVLQGRIAKSVNVLIAPHDELQENGP